MKNSNQYARGDMIEIGIFAGGKLKKHNSPGDGLFPWNAVKDKHWQLAA